VRRRLLDALFIDRDGTLIVERGFLGDPAGVRLSRGGADRLKTFVEGGTLVFIVTNQSGLARGLLTRDQVDRVNAEVERRLLLRGVPITEVLVCPHHPEGSVAELTKRCLCRKPGTLLHEGALARHGLLASRSAVIGDKWDDIGAAVSLGARAAHVLTGYGRSQRATVRERAPGAILATSLADALEKLATAGRSR
jgi:D-glycero-D-manno-heptose 1,7-bisphosphate phosphatase